MPVKLSTTIRKIALLPNATNAVLISEFHRYMKSHQNNCLKTNMAFAIFIGQNMIGKKKENLRQKRNTPG